MSENQMTKGGDGSHWAGCDEVHWDCKIAKLEAENEDLRSRLDDYRQDYEKTVNDQCPTDERHCGCVPILRRENRLLSEELADAKDELKHRRDALIDAQEIYNKANNFRFRYLSALEMIASFATANDKTTVSDLIGIADKEIGGQSDRVVEACNYWVMKLREEEDRRKAAESALISMVQQYCRYYEDDDLYGHDFMSAGEEAFAYLIAHHLAYYVTGAFITFKAGAQ